MEELPIRKIADDEIRITIWNSDGSIHIDEVEKAQFISDKKLQDAIEMINDGTPAYLAVTLAKQHGVDR